MLDTDDSVRKIAGAVLLQSVRDLARCVRSPEGERKCRDCVCVPGATPRKCEVVAFLRSEWAEALCDATAIPYSSLLSMMRRVLSGEWQLSPALRRNELLGDFEGAEPDDRGDAPRTNDDSLPHESPNAGDARRRSIGGEDWDSEDP